MSSPSTSPEYQRHFHRFEQQANQSPPGMAADLLDFLLHNKKWWLAPIIVVLLLVGLLVMLAGTGAAPFIYTLF